MRGFFLVLLGLAVMALSRLGAFSTTIANRSVDYWARGTTPTAVTAPIKMSLHTADPGATGASEVTGGSYARQNAGYNAASGGVGALAATVPFAALPACTVTHIGLWDSAGTPLFVEGAALAASKVINSGDTLNITAASLTLTGT